MKMIAISITTLTLIFVSKPDSPMRNQGFLKTWPDASTETRKI